MAERKITPKRRAQCKQLLEMLQGAGITDVAGVQGLFKKMVSTVLENGLEGELEDELGYSRYDYRNKETDNSRNGHSEKTLKTSYGDMEIAISQDRKGEFNPQIIKKQQTTLSGDIEEKILSMYAKGMSTSDIETHIREIYGLDVSDTTISRVTDKILPVVREWQARLLEDIYAVVFMAAIHFHVRSEGQIVKKAVYVGWRERKREVLAEHPQWDEKSGRQGHPDCMRGWPDRVPHSHRGRFPANGNPTVRHPPNPQQHAVSLSRYFGGKKVVQSAEIKDYRKIAGHAARCW